MKKIVAFIVVGVVFASCGPKRLGCGPRRCDLDAKIIESKPDKIVQKRNNTA